MIWLKTNAKNAALSHGVAAAGDIADSGGCHHQVFVAHDLGHGRGDLWNDGPLNFAQLLFAGRIRENKFAELTDGHAADRSKRFLIECLPNKPSDVVFDQ